MFSIVIGTLFMIIFSFVFGSLYVIVDKTIKGMTKLALRWNDIM